MKKVILLIIVVSMFVFSFGANFSDVAINHWAYEAIQKISSIGIIEGYPDKTFKGLDSVNRYQLTLTISRTLDYIEQSLMSPLTDKIAELDKKVKNMPTQSKDYSSEISVLNKNFSSLNDKMNDQSKVIEELKNSYELLGYTTSKLDEIENSVRELQKLNNSLDPLMDSKIVAVQETIKAVDLKVANLEKNNLEMSNKFDAIDSRLLNLEDLTSKVSNLSVKLNDFDSMYDELKQEADSVKNLQANLNSKIDLKADKMSVANLETKVNTLESGYSQVSKNEKDLADIKVKMSSTENVIADLNKEINDTNTKIENVPEGGIDFVDIFLSIVLSAGVTLAIINFSK